MNKTKTIMDTRVGYASTSILEELLLESIELSYKHTKSVPYELLAKYETLRQYSRRGAQ